MNNPHRQTGCLLLFCIGTSLLPFCSCVSLTPTTGTTVELDSNRREEIKVLGVVVGGAENFSVRSARDEHGTADAFAAGLVGTMGFVTTPIGLIWGAALQSGRIERDEEASSSIETATNEYNIADDFQDKIVNYGITAGLFDEIIKIDATGNDEEQSNNIDASLKVNIVNWGLRRVSEANNDDFKRGFLQAEIRIRAEIVSGNEEVLWSFSDHYITDRKYLISDILDNPNVLVEVFSDAVSDMSKRIINRLLYS